MVCEGHWPAARSCTAPCHGGLFPSSCRCSFPAGALLCIRSFLTVPLAAVVVSLSHVPPAGDGPSIDMAIALQLPKGAYVEMLEEWLLLQAYSGLWREMGHVSLPPALSMAVRNDIIHAAVNALEPELCTVFLDYAEKLQRELPRYAETSFPLPCELPMRPSSAECLAHALLEQGHGSLWTSVRQVAAELSYHTVHRAIGTHLSFSVGAYGHRSFVGLLKQTGTHRSVCRLLNALVTQIYPAHVWTTVTVNVDLKAPTHIDVANASYASLLLGLSHFDDGTLWTEHEAGTVYHEHGGRLIPGYLHQVSGAALLLNAHNTIHAVQPSAHGNRFTLVAHTIGQHLHLSEQDQQTLWDLGFGIPGAPAPAFPSPYLSGCNG